MVKKKKAGKRRNQKENKRNIQNRAAMLGISGVICMLLVILLFEGRSLKMKRDANEVKTEQLIQQQKEEQARTDEIEELQKYMQSDEYTEKIAKEKIGLVKENEIIFKENK